MKKSSKDFIKLLAITSFPVILQNLLQQSLSFCDTLMIGQLGEVEIAAVGLANQFYFFLSVIFFGVSTGTSIFTSQFWGIKDKKSMEKAVGIGLVLGVFVAGLFSFLSMAFPKFLLGIFSKDKQVVDCGSDYLVWVGISYVFVSVSQTISMNIRSTGDTKRPMYATLASMVINIIGNYVLIFVAKLGVVGAAIATVFSRLVEMIVIIFVNQKKCPVPLHFSQTFGFDFSFLKTFVHTTLPVILDDAQWALGITVYKYVYSQMGTKVLASANISESIQNLFMVFQMALGSGAAILIGNEIGRNNVDKAKEEAKLSFWSAVTVGLAAGVLMFCTSSVFPQFFNVSNEVRELSRKSLMAMSAIVVFKFINHVDIISAFRSGGDTKFALIVEILTVWFIGVPAAFLSGLVFKWPIYYVYLFIGLEEIIKSYACLPRLFSGKWIHNLTK